VVLKGEGVKGREEQVLDGKPCPALSDEHREFLPRIVGELDGMVAGCFFPA